MGGAIDNIKEVSNSTMAKDYEAPRQQAAETRRNQVKGEIVLAISTNFPNPSYSTDVTPDALLSKLNAQNIL